MVRHRGGRRAGPAADRRPGARVHRRRGRRGSSSSRASGSRSSTAAATRSTSCCLHLGRRQRDLGDGLGEERRRRRHIPPLAARARPPPHVLRLGARRGLARAAGLEPLPPLGPQPRRTRSLPRGLLRRGSSEPRSSAQPDEQLGEPLHRPPVPRRSRDAERPLEIVERQARAARPVRVAEVHLAALDDERIGWRAIRVERLGGGRRARPAERNATWSVAGSRSGLLGEERIVSRRPPPAPRRNGRRRRPEPERVLDRSATTFAATALSASDERNRTLPLCSTVATSSSPRQLERLAQLRHREPVLARRR